MVWRALEMAKTALTTSMNHTGQPPTMARLGASIGVITSAAVGITTVIR